MSNHSGGYMLSSVLEISKQMGIFDTIGKEKTLEFVKKIIDLGDGNDCNAGEILEGIGEELGLCYCCMEESQDIEWGLCKSCRG